MIAQIFIPIAELVIPTGKQTNEANAEIETQPVTVVTKIGKFSTYFKYLYVFLYFSVIKSLCFISFKISFLVSSVFLNINSKLNVFVLKIVAYYFATRRK